MWNTFLMCLTFGEDISSGDGVDYSLGRHFKKAFTLPLLCSKINSYGILSHDN